MGDPVEGGDGGRGVWVDQQNSTRKGETLSPISHSTANKGNTGPECEQAKTCRGKVFEE